MRYLVLLCLSLLFSISYSQNEILVNQYSQNIFAINASSSCLADNPEANIYYKKLWGGFFDSPEFSQLTLSGPVKNKNIGFGSNITYQQTGLFSYLTAQGSFSYKLKLNELNFLSFGIQAGIKRLQINFNKMNAQDPDEFIDLPQHQSSTRPTADFSVTYKHKTLLIFVSANQLLPGSFNYHDATYQPTLRSRLVPNYLAGVKWDKSVSQQFNNSICFVTRSHQGLPLQVEFSDLISWQHKFSIGLGYRQTNEAFAMVRVQLSASLTAGYCYEYTVKGLNKHTGGGHEINICYQFNRGTKENEKKSSNKNVNAIYDELDSLTKKLDANKKVTDSLNKHVTQLRSELNKIKKQNTDPNGVSQNTGRDATKDGVVNQQGDRLDSLNAAPLNQGDLQRNIEKMDSLDKNMQQLRDEFSEVQQQNLNQKVEKNTTDIDSLNKNVVALREEVNKLKIQFEKLEVIKTYIDSVRNVDNLNKSGATKKNVKKPVHTNKKKKKSRFEKLFTHSNPEQRPVIAYKIKPVTAAKKTNEGLKDSIRGYEQEKNLFSIECLIKDRKTLKLVNAEIVITETDTKIQAPFKKNSTGNWIIRIKTNTTYQLKCSSLGYINAETEVDISKGKSITVLMDALKVGDNFVMSSIYFHPNSYALKKESEPELKKLVDYLLNNPGINIEIQGHTNGDKKIHKSRELKDLGVEWNFRGSSKKLSANRAEVIKKYLMENGVSAERLETKGLGGSKPIIQNPDTMAEGQKNIRVEIVIIKN